MADTVTMVRVEPQASEIKRYEVRRGNELKGWVIQFMSRLNLAKETARLRIDGKTRPFWTFVELDGRAAYRVKLETRKDAVRWLLN